MTCYVLKFQCFRTDKVVMVRDGFRTRRQAYQYRDASYGWGPGRFVVSPHGGRAVAPDREIGGSEL